MKKESTVLEQRKEAVEMAKMLFGLRSDLIAQGFSPEVAENLVLGVVRNQP